MLVSVRDERCRARPIELLSCSPHVELASMRLQPTGPQPEARARASVLPFTDGAMFHCLAQSPCWHVTYQRLSIKVR